MKKILALVLAVVFMFALAIPAFAEETTTQITETADPTVDLNGDDQDVVVTYNVSGTYVVSVPAAITVTGTEGTADIIASDVRIKYNQVLTVSVSSDTDGFALVYYDDEDNALASADSIAYSVDVGVKGAGEQYNYSDLPANGLALTVNEGGVNNGEGASGGSVKLKFDFGNINNAKYQGQYKDTITFTVDVADYVAPGGEG